MLNYVIHLNIRVVKKLELLQKFSDEFDLITLTETQLDPDIEDNEFELDSFSKHIIQKDRNKFGGGLLIYSKEEIFVIRRREFENQTDEIIWVEIRVKGRRLLRCTTYLPQLTEQGYWA